MVIKGQGAHQHGGHAEMERPAGCINKEFASLTTAVGRLLTRADMGESAD